MAVTETDYRGCVWVSSLLHESMKIHCDAISWRIIHEGWDELALEDWPDDLLEFMA